MTVEDATAPRVIGFIAGVVVTLAAVIGIPWLIYYLWTHLQWISP